MGAADGEAYMGLRPGDLDMSFLLQIMAVMAEERQFYPEAVATGTLALALLPAETEGGMTTAAIRHVERHVAFLIDAGYVKQVLPATAIRHASFSLTLKGQTFVQPELLEFGGQPMLPLVIKSLEDKIQVLTYPEEEKSGMLYRLREALAEKAPDVIAKVIAEISAKIVIGRI